MEVSDISEDGLPCFQAQTAVTVEGQRHYFEGYEAIFLKVTTLLYGVSRCWRRSFCWFCKVTFTALSCAARPEKPSLSTCPGSFHLIEKLSA